MPACQSNYNLSLRLPWVSQLLTWLVRSEGKLVMEILSAVGRVYPQAVYFPLRTLYLTLKIEQREKQQLQPPAPTAVPPAQPPTTATATAATGDAQAAGKQQVPPAAAAGAPMTQVPLHMWRVSKIMHTQRDLHPTILSSLEGIVDQISGWLRDNWYEEVLRQLKQALAKCYAVAFENRTNIADAAVTPATLNFVKKLVSTFGIGFENAAAVQSGFTSGSESVAKSEGKWRNSLVRCVMIDVIIVQQPLRHTWRVERRQPHKIRCFNE